MSEERVLVMPIVGQGRNAGQRFAMVMAEALTAQAHGPRVAAVARAAHERKTNPKAAKRKAQKRARKAARRG